MATNPFTEHPGAVGETYSEHFAVALGVSRQLAGAAACALIHAVIPRFHTSTASDRIRALHSCLARHDRDGLRHHARVATDDSAA